MSARRVHLVGSVPLQSASEVFRAAAGALGPYLDRIPDGETGERSTWIAWQAKYFAEHPAFELEEPPAGRYAPLPRYRLKATARAAELAWADGIGYASVAIDSYAVFAALKSDGVIPSHVKFQVSLPTPVAPVAQFVSHADQAAVESAYERQLMGELDQICAAVPADQLAIQWDVAIELGMWEGIGGPFRPWFEQVKEGVVERLVRYGEATPADVDLGFHLCYGDFGHEHFVQPADAANLTEVGQAISDKISRSVSWIHMPVPRDRSDIAYFAPLSDLELRPETTLYLGLVHETDGVPGADKRIAAASAFVRNFGIATECGFGRRAPRSVLPLMKLHTSVAES
ncbi:MAG: hypothetical protein ACYDHH_07210 [Solirubrobacteraceae bacterium]